MQRCWNCYGRLDYHSDDACYNCYYADDKERKRRQLLRPYNTKGKRKKKK